MVVSSSEGAIVSRGIINLRDLIPPPQPEGDPDEDSSHRAAGIAHQAGTRRDV